jgi:hypothetical protein
LKPKANDHKKHNFHQKNGHLKTLGGEVELDAQINEGLIGFL